MGVLVKHNYKSKLDIYQTEMAIKQTKDYFENALSGTLSLKRVSAPLFVFSDSGLNDDLNGIEKPVSFTAADIADRQCEVVHSLAKWKRHALKRYGCTPGMGLYTDMNAIRSDERMDNIHSIYIDQWDWEVCITQADRTLDFLKDTVRKIYNVIYVTEKYINSLYPMFENKLPPDVYFITAQQLVDLYPDLTAKQREDAITKQHRAVFVMQIGATLSNAERHDSRAPDYDDWGLNGDLLLYSDVLESAVEMTSMGIRVDAATLLAQLKASGNLNRMQLPFHKQLLSGELPLTMGGGIGQSRLCMFYLEKLHIGEVHASLWSDDDVATCAAAGINLL